MSKQARKIIGQMVEYWNITDTDFMGYEREQYDIFSYHHLRIAKKDNGPITIHNGAVLLGQTSHPYLHLIERMDRDKFLYLTKILIEVNDQRYLPTHDQLLRCMQYLMNLKENIVENIIMLVKY